MRQWRCAVAIAVACVVFLTTIPKGWGQQTRRLDLVLDLDISGSMKKNDPHALMLETVSHFIGQLGPDDSVGLVLFGTRATVVQPLAPLAEPGQRDVLLVQIAQIRYADLHTNISAAIERGLYELKSKGRTGSGQALLFATDGIMDTGSPARDEEMKRWLRGHLLAEARQRGVRIFSIAFTEEADFTLVQEMARATGGEYFRAMSAQEIPGIFQQISAMLRKAPEVTLEKKADVAPAKPQSELPLWVGGSAVLLVALFAVIFFSWRSIRARPSGAAKEDETVALKAPLAEAAPVPPAELLDLETRDVVPLNKPVVRIGREVDNDVLITASTVSGHHAQIEYRMGQFYLKDLRSSNGTFVNKQKVEGEVLLRSGDVIRFDEFRYTFLGPEPMPGGTQLREALPSEPEGAGKRRKTLILEADSVKTETDLRK